MRIARKEPPRRFTVGLAGTIEIADCGEITLEPDEQVSFVTVDGKRHDFAAKNWGFYATPSVNARLAREGFKTALVRNGRGQVYVMVVDRDRLDAFEAYCREEAQTVLEWLDERPLA